MPITQAAILKEHKSMHNLLYINRWCMLLICLLLTNSLLAIQYRFAHLSIDDGLSHNDITAIVQDNSGFMWFATRDGLNRFDGKKIKVYKHPTNAPAFFDINLIKSLAIDTSGTIWIGSKGISYYDVMGDSLVYFSKKTKAGEAPKNQIIDIKVDSRNWVYFLERDKGIYCYKTDSDELVFYPFLLKDKRQGDKAFAATAMWIDADNRVWLGVDNGNLLLFEQETETYQTLKINCLSLPYDQLQHITGNNHFIYLGFQYSGIIRYDLERGIFSTITLNEQQQSESIFVHDILIDNHQLWVGTERGLYIHDEISKKTTHFKQDYFDPYSLSDNAIYALFKDKDDGFWIGTYFGGVNYLSLSQSKFVEIFYPLVNKNSLSGRVIREMCQDKNGKLWIGTEDTGLNCLDMETKNIERIVTDPRQPQQNTHGLAIIDDYLYVGNFAAALSIVNLKNNTITHHYISADQHNVQNSIYSILYDKKKRIWIGTRSGVYFFSQKNKTFERIAVLGDIFAHNIFEDSHGNVWLSTLGQGVICYTANKQMVHYNKLFADQLGHTVDKVLSTFEDSKGRMWFATSGNGVISYNATDNKFNQYTTSSGLPDDVVYKVIEDLSGNLWFGTNKGLVYLNVEKKKIRVFTKNDGLPSNQFNYNSAFRDSKGKLYFGTIAGLIAIDPLAMKDDTVCPPAFLTGFQIYNKEVKIAQHSPLQQSIIYTNAITLAHNQNTISFDIAVLQYAASQKNGCWVILEGLDKKWTYLGGELRISYANLATGKYTLRIKSSNSFGDWHEVKALTITILPPWWKTIPMFFVYTFLILGTIICIYWLTVKRIEKRQALIIQKMEQERERESYHAKIDFFTSIAHEIKNPLSLIKAPLEYILNNKSFDGETKESLQTMMKNTDRLLSLTYQLLDFRKIENKRMALNIEQTDIAELIRVTYDRFKTVAEQQKIEFTLVLEKNTLQAEVDIENFIKIISNLFNNALKYTHSYIQSKLTVLNEDEFQIIVDNDGQLIDPSMCEKIFEPFIQLAAQGQLNSGRGLGLFLARSLTELHGGRLIYDLSHTACNRFVLTLPLIHQHKACATNNNENHEEQKYKIDSENGQVKQRILVVEDNLEMLDFVSKKLMATYNVSKAIDGAEAIKMLKDTDVDLIISDIMMPNMNGFELLQAVKSQVEYSHIPIILLTAKTNLQSKIEGLELGADAYIEKPFSLEFVLAQIQNLLKNRQSIKESFSKRPLTEAKIVALTKSDELFLQKISEIIEQNITNVQFSVDVLADKLSMSSSSLYRKIKGLSDLTPNDYIRLHRLKKAALLLQEGSYRINEIAVITGFASASYFTKCFQQHFDMLPKDFAKNINK